MVFPWFMCLGKRPINAEFMMPVRLLGYTSLLILISCTDRPLPADLDPASMQVESLDNGGLDRCREAAATSTGAVRLGQAIGRCLEDALPGPFALRREVQVSTKGARLVAQAGANPLIPASVLETCVSQRIHAWSAPPIDEVLRSTTGLVETMSLELGREQEGELQVRSRSTCSPPLPGEPMMAAMEPLELAPNCEAPLGSAAKRPAPFLFGLNIVRSGDSDKGAVCSPVTDRLPSGFITCICADLMARDAATSAREGPSTAVKKGTASPAGHRHWILRRRIAGRAVYHRLEGLSLP